MKKFLLLIILLFSCSILAADDLTSKQQDLDRLNAELAHQQQLLEQTKRREKTTLRDLYVINKKILEIRNEIRFAQRRLNITLSYLQQAQQDLQKTSTQYRSKQELFAHRLKEIYKTQNLGYLYLFLSSKNFSDLVDNSYYYSKIIGSDIADIRGLTSSLYTLKQKTRELQQKKQEIETIKFTMQQQKNEYSNKAKIKQAMYSNLRAQRLEYERRIDELLRNSKEIEEMIQRLMRSGSTGARGTGRFAWPLRGNLTSYYGYRRHPIFKVVKFHTGIDIAARHSTRILAADSGVVIFTGWWGGYGQATIVDHGRGFSTVYAHQSRILVRKGDHIAQGQVIGLVGSTGYSTGPHLHFEIRIDGRTTDPLKFL